MQPLLRLLNYLPPLPVWGNVLTFILISYSLANIINTGLGHWLKKNTPEVQKTVLRGLVKEPQPLSMHELASRILSRNLIDARREELNKTQVAKNETIDTYQPCSITAAISAIVAGDSPESSYLIYRTQNASDVEIYSPYAEGDANRINDNLILLSISRNQALFRKDNHLELCTLGGENSDGAHSVSAALTPPVAMPDPNAGGIKQVRENEYQIEQAELDRSLQNMNEILTDARAFPAIKDGKAEGFRITSIRPGSIYQKLGIQNGDVVQKINGMELNSPDKALELYAKLRQSKSFAIQIERQGSVKNFSYNVK